MAQAITAVLGLWCALAGAAWAQTGANAPQPATSAPAAPTAGPTSTEPVPGPGLALYRKLRDVGLDPAAVYNVRDAAIQREDLHITLDDGTLAFVRSVDGHVTGAFFEGEGEVLLFPPDHAERGSLALFTGEAILEEKFTTAYFRFNDRTAEELQPSLRRDEEAQAFVEKYDKAARTLAEADALRLMTTYLNQQTHADDRLFRARLQGAKLGIFDIYFDTLLSEQITVLKLTYSGGAGFYDVLCSFLMRSARNSGGASESATDKGGAPAGGDPDETGALKITKYTIKARIDPPHVLGADVTLDIDVRRGEQRIEFFELSRYLKLTAAEADGKAIEFLQNEAIEGSALARRGNDVIAVVFPEALHSGQKLRMKFTYAGNVLSDAGGGLVYVGARGVWYPNRGLSMADYDLEFRYPQGWTLVATGQRASQERTGTEQVSHYVSERPMPVAGFNLGRYSVASATAASNVRVDAYATAGVESAFPQQRQQVVMVPPQPREPRVMPPIILAPRSAPEPASHAEVVAQRSARAIDFFARNFGPYPYGSLTLSQMPGSSSQGWPGLIFLSSYAFLSPEELRTARVHPEAALAYSGFTQAHETAHQWWGDLVGWKTYRDQWLVEALASYSAILAYENDRAADSKQTLRNYRAQLLSKNAEGEEYARAGPVTLGVRLASSHFPDGYDIVSYGRGAWLLHMLRTMMQDAAGGSDESFLRGLRRLRDRYQEKEMTTSDFLRVMAEELPDSLRYEDSKSLEWFLDSWVKGTAIPRLELKDVKVLGRGAGAVVTGKILQMDAPDELVTSVPVYGNTGKVQVLLGRVFADGKETSFRLPAPVPIKNVVLDPFDTVLKR